MGIWRVSEKEVCGSVAESLSLGQSPLPRFFSITQDFSRFLWRTLVDRLCYGIREGKTRREQLPAHESKDVSYMPMGKRITTQVSDAAVADFLASKEPIFVVAKRHNMGQSTLFRFLKMEKEKKRENKLKDSAPIKAAQKTTLAETQDTKTPVVSRAKTQHPIARGFTYSNLKPPVVEAPQETQEVTRLHKCIVDLVLQVQKLRQAAAEAGVVLPS